MSKKLIWILLFAIAIGGVIYFRHTNATGKAVNGSASKSKSGSGRPGGSGRQGAGDLPVPVVPGIVAKHDVPIYLDGIGTVQAFNTVNVKARVDGQIDKILFTEGQDVQAGELLANIDPRPYQAQLDQVIAKKAQDEAQLNNARVVLKRDEDLISKKVLDQQSYETQKFLVDQMVATVQGDQAAIDNARTQLDYTRVTAPITGRVGVRQVDQGNIIHAGDSGGLVVITQLHPISVVFTLPEQNFQLIRDNTASNDVKDAMKVLAVGSDNASLLGEGTLAVIDNQIDQSTGTLKLKATFANEDLRLWPGQFINSRLLLTTRKNGITVPAAVVQRGPQGSYAFVIKPDMTVEIRTVKVAQIEDGQALIDEGLNEGETVVVDGQYKLEAGSKVVIVNENGGDTREHPNSGKGGQRKGTAVGPADKRPAASTAPAVTASR